ncbi:MAG TPA: outer membrane beta-barrel protein, partial [Candidatus Methylacidiphilales bacterium]
MNKALKSVTVLALLSSVAFAGEEAKDLKKKIEDQAIYVETAKPGIVLSGYVDAGYQYSFTGSGTTTGNARFPGDRTASGGRFDVNAVKIALEKPLSTKNEFTSGFRVDGMVGADVAAPTATTTSITGGTNATAIEQAYVQLRVPAGNGIDLKIGKFVTILGYEVIERPANLNVSYSNVFWNM